MTGFYNPSRKSNNNEPEKDNSNKQAKNDITINITFNIGNTENHFEQRAEGGGQINKDVGTNANQGGQNALNHSQTRNLNSQFADGNGRSSITGDDNDEADGIKVHDSDSAIHSQANQPYDAQEGLLKEETPNDNNE